MTKKLFNKCKTIKFVLTDVDGVLTDGGLYYSKSGDTMKKFFVRDGMGVSLLKKSNIYTIIVTKEKNKIIQEWTKNMPIKKLFDGVLKKEIILEKICKAYNVNPNQVAYIGDDVNDLELLKLVGLSAVPSDGIIEAKNICDYVCKNKGGCGAFREFAELILQAQKNPNI